MKTTTFYVGQDGQKIEYFSDRFENRICFVRGRNSRENIYQLKKNFPQFVRIGGFYAADIGQVTLDGAWVSDGEGYNCTIMAVGPLAKTLLELCASALKSTFDD